MTTSLMRLEVEVLLAQGHRWTINHCAGARTRADEGEALVSLPDGVLNPVPTQAAL